MQPFSEGFTWLKDQRTNIKKIACAGLGSCKGLGWAENHKINVLT